MISIRKATQQDIPFIEAHAYRLLQFDLPAWRKGQEKLMTGTDIKYNAATIVKNEPDSEVLIAFDENDQPCGFLHLTMLTDYYTQERHAHITDIVVIKEAEGKGIGKELMQKADDWAYTKNARFITLNVFEANKHAQRLYEKSGYEREWVKYMKQL